MKRVVKKEAEVMADPLPVHLAPEPNRTYTPILVIFLIVASFFMGSLYTKIQYLEKGNTMLGTTTNTTPAPAVTSKPQVAPLHIAKAIGMDENKFKTCLDSGKYTKQIAQDTADAQKVGVNSTPSTFVNGQIVVGAEPYASFKSIIDQEIAQPNYPLPTGTRADVTTGPFPIIGDSNAPVTIVEFADFQCPFCEQFFNQTEKNIITDYVKTGKVQFAFRNFAFLGPDSTTAAEGAYCANDQGKFWEYHNYLYSHQGQENSGWVSKANLE